MTKKKAGSHAQEHSLSNAPLKHFDWRKGAPRLLVCIVAVILLFVMKEIDSGSSTPENESREGYRALFSPDFIYQCMVGKAQPPAKYVSLIIISEGSLKTLLETKEESSTGFCKRRLLLGRLLSRLFDLNPAVVVLDMWFDPESCPKEQSSQFWDELDAFSKTIHVVSGIGSDTLFEATSDRPAELAKLKRRRAVLKPTQLVSKPAINLIHPGSGQLTEGVVELDSDNRKIPLSWPVYDSFATIGETGQPRQIDSLSIAAVRAFDYKNPVLKRVGALDSFGSPIASTSSLPYTSFLDEDDLPILAAEDVICAGAPLGEAPPSCPTVSATTPDLKASISGKIVIIGYAGFGSDTHKSLIGKVPGVVLQANYVESLMENRAFIPLRTSYQFLIWVGWLAILFSIPSVVSRRRLVLPSLAVGMLFPAFLILLLTRHAKIYMPLLTTLLLYGIVLFVTRKIESLLDDD